MDRSATTSSVASASNGAPAPPRSATAAPGGADGGSNGLTFVPISELPAEQQQQLQQSAPTTRGMAMSTAVAPREHSPSVAAPPVSSEVVRAPVSVAAVSDRKSIVGMSEADKKIVTERVEALWVKWQLKTKADDTLDADKVKLVVLAESVVNHTKLTPEQLKLRVDNVVGGGTNRVKTLKEGLIAAIVKAGLHSLDDVEQQSDSLQAEANKAGLSAVLSKGNGNGTANGTGDEDSNENCRSCKSGCTLM